MKRFMSSEYWVEEGGVGEDSPIEPIANTLYSTTCGGGIAKWLRRRSANRTAPIFNELSAARRKHGRCNQVPFAPRG